MTSDGEEAPLVGDVEVDATVLTSIVEESQEAVMLVDPKADTIRAVSRQACQLLGYTSDELLDRPLADLQPDDGERLSEIGEDVIESGVERSGTFFFETQAGDRLPVQLSASRIRLGDQPAVLVLMRDVSERAERERQLKAQYNRLQAIVENAPIVLFTLDDDGVFLQTEGLGLETLGLDAGEIVGESVFDIYADQSDFTECVRRALDGEEVHATVRIDDASFDTWYQPVVGEGGVKQVLGVAVDVTERRRYEERLERLNAATRDLMTAESVADVADRAVSIASEVLDLPAAAMWQYDAMTARLDPLATTDAAIDLASDDRLDGIPQGTAEMAAFLAGEPAVIEEYTALENPADPESRLGRVLFVPLGDHGLLSVGSPAPGPFESSTRELVEILARDAEAAIDRVQRERDLRDRERALQRKNERLEEFASLVSHDLRNPLNLLSGHLELARETGDAEHFDAMERAVDRMTRLIEDVLLLARQDRDLGALEMLDLSRVAKEAWAAIGTEAATLEVVDELTIEADEDRLTRLLENLFRNAIEHAGEDVTVRIGAQDDGFYVADDGPGIPESDRDAVFEMGFSTADEGTGFGLAIVEEIAGAHEWAIALTESESGGARFEFSGVGMDPQSG